ncbi:siderophore-interacting protein [Amycolatopsis sacchari]|uniref:NADPH-dependent ferric siderophore reductase, contains FAD-binding and SIP domains n=1 Tax=Amycolatopsis sacchari TaxID=115433 RepID=A0A1I3XY94_9PSEU|nr:siderophore-interacting protein [Amycolatopsis sacchari]SFK24528.1 NADPH-dependent ferric siderophore reductase, contains FAD-binding and SIP domains [Amycolatopsis sacchari]
MAVFCEIQVARVRRLSPHMARISFTGEGLRGLTATCPDAYVKLFFPLAGQERPELPDMLCDSWYQNYLGMPEEIRPPIRTYTVRAHRGTELDIDFVLHGDTGPASRWALSARPGQTIALLGTGGLHTVPAGTDYQLLIGDETALPAIGAILERLSPGAVAHAYIEVPSPAEQQRFTTLGNVEVHWLHRGAQAHGQAVLNAVRMARLPEGTPYGWISGEAGMVKFARRHLVNDRGIAKSNITFTGYWCRGATHDQLV